MVPEITIPGSLKKTLNYNEHKVQRGVAQCIASGNTLKDGQDMNFYEKLNTFEKRNELNDRAKTKTLHVSLNFHPSEKFTNEQLALIAEEFMEKTGFGDQPYFVYRHHDAGHPHVHVVSTLIREDGTRINTHNLGRNQAQDARREIEEKWGLVKAEKQDKTYTPKPVAAEKLIYGKSETKQGIGNVLQEVFHNYRYTSLPGLNAALKQFNVRAEQGEEESRMYQNKGLMYRVLDSNGNATGIPIKASSFHFKPTLKNLGEKFKENETLREPHAKILKTKIDEAVQKATSLPELVSDLKTKNISVVIRQNGEGRVYGITFVDNNTKCVFNGSDIGKEYSVGGLIKNMQKKYGGQKTEASSPSREISETTTWDFDKGFDFSGHSVLETLLNPEEDFDPVSSHLLPKKRKRKKKRLGL